MCHVDCGAVVIEMQPGFRIKILARKAQIVHNIGHKNTGFTEGHVSGSRRTFRLTGDNTLI